ncbi:MAG: hypothetical protein ACMXX6_00965 [Candidatus Woesearchaeota archaeon]
MDEKFSEILVQRHNFIANYQEEIKNNQDYRELKSNLLSDSLSSEFELLKKEMIEIERLFSKVFSKAKFIQNDLKLIINNNQFLKLQNRLDRKTFEDYISRNEFERLVKKSFLSKVDS